MSRPELLTAASRIGFQICRDALWDSDACNWLGWASEFPDSNPVYHWQSLGSNIYEGTAGIAWFLTQLAVASQEPLHRQTALGAVTHALAHQGDAGPRMNTSFFSGALGIAVTAIEAGIKLQVEQLVRTGFQTLASASAVVDEQEPDVIGGLAGAIPLLIGLGRQFNDQPLLDSAIQHAEKLLQRSSRQLDPSGSVWERCWKNPAFGKEGLTGYSHGAAGMANALLEVAQLTGESRFRDTALETLAFERRWFNQEQQNWLDLRIENAERTPVSGCAWCHGAPGIGLARLRTRQLLPEDPRIADEIRTAIATTTRSLGMRTGQGANFSLCHGLLGNSELILTAAAHGENVEEGMRAAWDTIDFALERHARTHIPWKCGTPDGRSTPGLLLGTAGIGCALLHFYNPSVNCVPLLLTPHLVSLQPA